MQNYHARTPGEGTSHWISPEEISARAAAAAANNMSSHTASLRTSSSSYSSSASFSNVVKNPQLAQAEDSSAQLGRGKRRKRATNRFTTEARKGREQCPSSSSSLVVPEPKRRTIAVERRLEMASSEDEQVAEEARMVYRCPFEGCPDGSASSPGWLQRGALIAHVNSVHLSLPGVSLPAEFEQSVQLCPRCHLIVTTRGCAACQGKQGRAGNAPVVRMEVDALQDPHQSLPGIFDILTTKVSILHHVPKGFRIDWYDLLAEELDNFCETRNAEALALLLLLPKVILLVTDRGGRRAKRQVLNVCRERIKTWKEQNWHALWNNALNKNVNSRNL